MAGTRKKRADNWLPLRVYRGKSKYEWRPKGGKTVPLCPLDATQADVWQAYEAAQGKVESRDTVSALAEGYFASLRFLERKPRTQADYLEKWETVKPVFGHLPASKIKPKHIRAYMDERGKTAKVSANRERAVLYNIFAWGYERGLIPANPCIGVSTFPEKGRTRYIEDEEYYQVLSLSSPIVQIFMELSYLLGARGQDVRKIRIGDIRKAGIFVQQQKTGKKQIKGWTPRLREVVSQAMKRRRAIVDNVGVASLYLVVNERGQPYTESGLKTLWAKNRAGIEAEHNDIEIDWTFHDIKAKAISDYEGDKQEFSGHRSRLQMEDYNRKPAVVSALNPNHVRKHVRKKRLVSDS